MPDADEPKKSPGTDTLARLLLDILERSGRIELENVTLEIGQLEVSLHPGTPSPLLPLVQPAVPVRPKELLPSPFHPAPGTWPGKVREVVLGATASRGGSRRAEIVIGGSTTPAMYPYEDRPKAPVISLDVFDTVMPMPQALIGHVGDAREDPAEWARLNVSRFGAEMVTVHLISTDPLRQDASSREACRTVEEVLQAVDVPLVIGGCGDPVKDALVFSQIAETASGERLLFNSVTLDMSDAGTLGKTVEAIRDNGHVVLAFTGLDLNSAKELNRRLYTSLPPEDIVMDLTTVALGYGLEYSFSIHERARMAALMGDPELSHPTVSAATNAWAAREAWMKLPDRYGKKDVRGPLWETVTALTLMSAGVDLFFMMHPAAVHTVRSVMESRKKGTLPQEDGFPDWVEARMPWYHD